MSKPQNEPTSALSRQASSARRARQEWLLLGAVLLAVLLFVSWSRYSDWRHEDDEQRHLLATQAQAIDQILSRQLIGVAAALRGVRDDLGVWPANLVGVSASRRLVALGDAIPGVQTMLVLDRTGRALASNRPELIGQDFRAQDYFRQARDRPDPARLSLSPPSASVLGVFAMNLTIPVAAPDGAFDGVVTATLDPVYLRGLLHTTLYADDVWSGIGHGNGLVLLQEPGEESLAGRKVDQPGTFFRRHRESGQVATVMTGIVPATGERRLMAQRTVRPAGLGLDAPVVIAVGRNLDAIFAPWWGHTAAYGAFFVLFAAASAMALVAMQRRQRAVEGMEIEREEAGRRAAERLELALRGADLALWDLDVRSGASTVNERWNSMIGLPHRAVYPDGQAWISRIHPDDRERVTTAQRDHLEGRSDRFQETYRMRHADGHWVWILDRARVLERDAHGAPLRMLGTHMDTTESTLRQVALRANEQRLRSLLDNLRAGVIVHGVDARIVDANPAACEIAGLTLEQLRGKAVADTDRAFLEEDGSPMPPERLPAPQVMARDGPVKSLVLGVCRPGLAEPLWVLADAYPLRDAAGRIEQIVVTFSDITERKKATQELHLLGAAVAHLNDMVMITEAALLDEPGPRIRFVNEAFERITGWSRGEALGRSPRILQGPKSDRAELARIGAALRRHEPVHAELINYTRQGREYWVELDIVPILDRSGRATHLVAIERDITERKQVEAGLQRLNRSLRVLGSCNVNLAEQGDEQSFLAGVCRSVVAAGGYAMAWVGFAADDADKPVRVVAQAGDETGYLDSARVSWDGAQASGQGPTGEAIRTGCTQVNQDWRTNPKVAAWREAALQRGFHSSIALALSNGQRAFGALSLYASEPDAFGEQEIAPLEELARNVAAGIESLRARRQRDDAQGANRAKSAFLANMSHEIRTPLNAIVGLNYLMRRDGVSPEQAARLDKIDSASQHLLSIIDDVLDLSKIEAGRVQLESTNFHLSSILDNVHSIIAESAREKGLAVRVDGDAVPPWLRGDPTRLRQALLNFAGNAVKFTHTGSITLGARLLEDDASGLLVRFSVEDTGIGIASEHLPRLFQVFEQADPSITRKFGGTGLGLAITQRLAQLMGGECGVHSEPGAGSRFWFTARLQRGHGAVPVATLDAATNAEEQLRRGHRGARILLAEDNEVNREVALAMLHGVGMNVDIAADGREALNKVRTGRYDLVLMDMQMPEMGGLEATQAIRALPGWRDRPILALTANAFQEDRLACEAAGMNDFIAKPMDVGALYSALLRWLEAGAATRADA